MSGLADHLAGGITTTCLCWAVTRRDGVEMGFTDHDRDLAFEGVTFRAGTGLTARALAQVAGLAVDNSEAVGALSDAGVRAEDITAGRFDGAAVRLWQVNWQDVAAREMRFRGTLGEVTQAGAEFRAELRGLSEALNRTEGRVLQPGCDAVLGDARCGVDLSLPEFGGVFAVEAVREGRVLVLALAGGFAAGWFAQGTLRILDGAAAGLSGSVKRDAVEDGLRLVELWEEPAILPAPGDRVDLRAGCDRMAETCRSKFSNFMNFRGFPHVPDEDWITASPRRSMRTGAA
ncbi:DUF2163 domain-containing protein [Paragemmobacter ruber]|uniref:DUF2163 domain-containing protein n=1 Tax=Paragemmobacter ruber TaxID=1985673 RepID=A0ABW9YA61_9RHOB|nr:DUF2163 domain-containing protein [Rhodobacter ruber]NBE08677.1 DUF2163 domain-containing protein [Rhodobacter ruber]